ncbi:MAG: rhomboid family intramembrane serine protease, partial [Armatimonadetes bacterium]|nr:rhomboid family intramembrane serine protease [Armatimonadota bacterium]
MFPLRDDVPARRSPIVLYALVVVNVLVFLYELSLPAPALRQFVANLGVVPADFAGPGGRIEPEPSALATLFTSMFIHAGWLHILVNMWYLWIFGNNIEDRMGHLRFLVFYLLGGVAAGLAHLALNWGSPVPSIG